MKAVVQNHTWRLSCRIKAEYQVELLFDVGILPGFFPLLRGRTPHRIRRVIDIPDLDLARLGYPASITFPRISTVLPNKNLSVRVSRWTYHSRLRKGGRSFSYRRPGYFYYSPLHLVDVWHQVPPRYIIPGTVHELDYIEQIQPVFDDGPLLDWVNQVGRIVLAWYIQSQVDWFRPQTDQELEHLLYKLINEGPIEYGDQHKRIVSYLFTPDYYPNWKIFDPIPRAGQKTAIRQLARLLDLDYATLWTRFQTVQTLYRMSRL